MIQVAQEAEAAVAAGVVLIQEEGMAAVVVIEAEVIVVAGAEANLLKPNLLDVQDLIQSLHHDPLLSQKHALCQDLYQDPGPQCHLVRKKSVKAQRNRVLAEAAAGAAAGVYPGKLGRAMIDHLHPKL